MSVCARYVCWGPRVWGAGECRCARRSADERGVTVTVVGLLVYKRLTPFVATKVGIGPSSTSLNTF